MAKLIRLETKQTLNVGIDVAWDFFSDPRNLAKITPPNMGFVIQTPLPTKAYSGLIIEYTVSPILGVPLRWVTEITHLQDKRFFVDEQRFGPYSFWHHQHHFVVVEGKVIMHDILHYRLPFGILGKLVDTLFVRKQVSEIFAFRTQAVNSIFNQK